MTEFARFFRLTVVECIKERIQKSEFRIQEDLTFMIYDTCGINCRFMIVFEYFMLLRGPSCPSWLRLVEKTNPIVERANIRKVLYERIL